MRERREGEEEYVMGCLEKREGKEGRERKGGRERRERKAGIGWLVVMGCERREMGGFCGGRKRWGKREK